MNSYVPYRNSKLTRILKNSLSGNCKTVMIVNISPYVKSFEDTHNTLVYANRCKNIKTHVIQNVYNEETIDYSKEITDLLEENKLLKE